MVPLDIDNLFWELEQADYQVLEDQSDMKYGKIVVYNENGVYLDELEDLAGFYGASVYAGANKYKALIYL